MNPVRTGLLGGTFDPVHNGHLFIALEAAWAYGLQRVCFMPSARPPHKAACPSAPAPDRLAMLELASRDIGIFTVSDAELKRGGVSYTIETVREFKRSFPSSGEIYFITGFDSYRDFSSWKDSSELLDECRFITAPRSLRDAEEMARGLEKGFLPLFPPVLEISSTEIRERIGGGRHVRCLVPEKVENYIREYGLYSK